MWSFNGGTTISTSIKKFGNGSLYVPNGGSASVTIDPPWSIGTGNYKVEFWYNISSVASAGDHNDVSFQIGSLQCGLHSNGKFYFDDVSGSTTNWGFYTPSTVPYNGTWNHFAAVRNGSYVYLYINGSNVTSLSSSAVIRNTGSAYSVVIGLRDGTSNHDPFYIDDLRVSGSAVYTSNFSVPSGELT
jgi:hypothetical protein